GWAWPSRSWRPTRSSTTSRSRSPAPSSCPPCSPPGPPTSSSSASAPRSSSAHGPDSEGLRPLPTLRARLRLAPLPPSGRRDAPAKPPRWLGTPRRSRGAPRDDGDSGRRLSVLLRCQRAESLFETLQLGAVLGPVAAAEGVLGPVVDLERALGAGADRGWS